MKLIKVFLRSPVVVVTSVLVFLFLLFAFSAEAQVRFTYSSSVLGASSVVLSKVPCLVTGVSVLTDGTNDVTLILYDNKTNTGTILYKLIVLGATKNRDVQFAIPVKALLGVYMSLSGTGANAIVYTTPE